MGSLSGVNRPVCCFSPRTLSFPAFESVFRLHFMTSAGDSGCPSEQSVCIFHSLAEPNKQMLLGPYYKEKPLTRRSKWPENDASCTLTKLVVLLTEGKRSQLAPAFAGVEGCVGYVYLWSLLQCVVGQPQRHTWEKKKKKNNHQGAFCHLPRSSYEAVDVVVACLFLLCSQVETTV